MTTHPTFEDTFPVESLCCHSDDCGSWCDKVTREKVQAYAQGRVEEERGRVKALVTVHIEEGRPAYVLVDDLDETLTPPQA